MNTIETNTLFDSIYHAENHRNKPLATISPEQEKMFEGFLKSMPSAHITAFQDGCIPPPRHDAR